MRDLNGLIRPGSGWVLNTATDINIWGQIVGSGTLDGQKPRFSADPEGAVNEQQKVKPVTVGSVTMPRRDTTTGRRFDLDSLQMRGRRD